MMRPDFYDIAAMFFLTKNVVIIVHLDNDVSKRELIVLRFCSRNILGFVKGLKKPRNTEHSIHEWKRYEKTQPKLFKF